MGSAISCTHPEVRSPSNISPNTIGDGSITDFSALDSKNLPEELSNEDVMLPPGLMLKGQSESSNSSNYIQGQNLNNYFDWPVDEARLTRGFIPYPTGRRKKPHLGLDLAAPKGTRIFSSHDGVVLYVGREFKGYGRMVLIEGYKGFATLYAHLSSTTIKEGERIKQGDFIGGMGRTGRASGVHLHFEIRKERGPVDPMEYLPGGAQFARK